MFWSWIICTYYPLIISGSLIPYILYLYLSRWDGLFFEIHFDAWHEAEEEINKIDLQQVKQLSEWEKYQLVTRLESTGHFYRVGYVGWGYLLEEQIKLLIYLFQLAIVTHVLEVARFSPGFIGLLLGARLIQLYHREHGGYFILLAVLSVAVIVFLQLWGVVLIHILWAPPWFWWSNLRRLQFTYIGRWIWWVTAGLIQGWILLSRST